jgi:hypothetical protein
MKHRVKLFEYFEGDEADTLRDLGILGNKRYRYILSGKVKGSDYSSSKSAEWRLQEMMQTFGETYDRTLEIIKTDATNVVDADGHTSFYKVSIDFTSEIPPRDVGFGIYTDISKYFYRKHYDYNKIPYNA